MRWEEEQNPVSSSKGRGPWKPGRYLTVDLEQACLMNTRGRSSRTRSSSNLISIFFFFFEQRVSELMPHLGREGTHKIVMKWNCLFLNVLIVLWNNYSVRPSKSPFNLRRWNQGQPWLKFNKLKSNKHVLYVLKTYETNLQKLFLV